MKKTGAGILSGEQLVEIGATKHTASLPELGVKNVLPTGSWLENKQIQAAIENRTHLLEIEKIEKRGVLSKAKWDEDLGLAEVTQIVGGHWQYLGHAYNKKNYLKPEEALYLLETNCLHLTYNDVTVSVQQAYTLLLRGKVSLIHYKVYASLSRVGYKILRHEYTASKSNDEGSEQVFSGDVEVENVNSLRSKEGMAECRETEEKNQDNSENEQNESMEINAEANSYQENTKIEIHIAADIVESTNECTENITEISPEASTSAQQSKPLRRNPKRILSRKEIKLNKFKERKYSTLSGDTIAHCFENLPEMVNGKVELKAPDESLLPRNVFPNCTTYLIDIDKVKVKNVSPSERPPYSASDEVNGSHIRRIGGPAIYANNQYTNFNRHSRNQHNNQPYFSLFNFQRLRHPNLGFDMSFIPKFFPQFHRLSQPHFQRFQQNFSYRQRTNNNANNRMNSSARRCDNYTKDAHLNLIKYLIHRLKSLLGRGQNDLNSLTELLRQLQAFNTKHGTRLRLTKTFDILDETEIVTEVINLEDEDSPPAKKTKVTDDSKYKENLNSIKDLSKRLGEMVKNGEAFARHRRALSNAIKIFNKVYKTELFIKDNNEIGNRKEIVIDSSDSDCMIEDLPVKSKKLRNPFNILKRRSLDVTMACQINAKTINEPVLAVEEKYDDSMVHNFKKWLPSETDFGRPEIITQVDSCNFIQDTQTELFLFDYLKEYNFNYENWCEVKTSFWESLKESSKSESEVESDNNTSTDSLLSTEDFTDLSSMLEKIRVIKNCNESLCDSSLAIDFDVYNRDVPNFRKTCLPKPHYRIICIDEQSPIPSGAEVATLHAKYTDDVTILFAIVGPGSINYIQMNPSDIPVYLPNSEITNMINEVFGFIFLSNIVSVSVIICMCAFLSFVIPGANTIENMISFLGAILLAYNFSWPGQMLYDSSLGIGTAAYNIRWYKKDVKLQKYILLIILRSNKPCYLSAFGSYNITLESFAKMLSGAWSYLSLLRRLYQNMDK